MKLTRCEVKRLLRTNRWVFNHTLTKIAPPVVSEDAGYDDYGWGYLRSRELEAALKGSRIETQMIRDIISTDDFDVGYEYFRDVFDAYTQASGADIIAYRFPSERTRDEEA